MAICKSCKQCTKDVQAPQEMVEIVDKSWCIVWDAWQVETAKQCKYYESKGKDNPYFEKDSNSEHKKFTLK